MSNEAMQLCQDRKHKDFNENPLLPQKKFCYKVGTYYKPNLYVFGFAHERILTYTKQTRWVNSVRNVKAIAASNLKLYTYLTAYTNWLQTESLLSKLSPCDMCN